MRGYFILIITLLSFSCNKNQQVEKNRPNIVFILTDDQTHDAIHAIGNKDIITPTMDSLVNAGTSFSNAYIMGGSSPAVCMPSRAMLLTSKTMYHLQTDESGNPWKNGSTIPEAHKTLPEILKEQGYTTFATGKWHQDYQSFNRSFVAGKNIFFDGMGDHWRLPLLDYRKDGNYPSYDSLKNLKADNLNNPKGKHSTELFTDAVVDFIKKNNGATPFFTYVSYTAPHDPREMPEEFKELYKNTDITLPPNFMPRHPFDNGEMNIRDEKLAPWPRTDSIVKAHLLDYYAMISHLDAQIKRIFDILKEKHIADNTIIIFAGDNGLALGQHGLMGKQSLYEHSIKVPLIFSGPGIREDEKRSQLAYLIDIYPTICELVEIDIPESVEGKSLLHAIKSNQKVRENIYFAYTHVQRAVRNDSLKLIEYSVDDERHTQLFNLKEDPWEMNNLSDNTNYLAEVEKMRKLLVEGKDNYDDTLKQGKEFWDGVNF